MFLPKLADEHKISQSDIKIENTEFLSSDLKIKRPDVLFRVRTKDREAFVYILIEHQSYKDHNMALRIYDYTGRIWTNYVKENHPRSKRKFFKYPQVIPIVFYTGSGRWTPARDIGDKIDCVEDYVQYCPSFKYMVIELSTLDKRWLLKVKTVLSKLLYAAWIEDIREIFKELKRAIDELNEGNRKLFYSYLKTLLIGSGCSASEAEEAVRSVEEEEGESMIRLLSKERKAGRIEGRKEGRKEGRIEGLLEAKRQDIYEILEERFGKVPEDIKETVEKISDTKKLSILHRKSISVKDFDEFRKLLKSGSE